MNVLTTTTRRVSGMACLLLAAMTGSASALDDGQARNTLDPAPAPNWRWRTRAPSPARNTLDPAPAPNHPDAPARATSLTWNQPEAQARATPDPAPRATTAGGIHPPGLPCGYTVEVIKGPNHPNFGYPIMYPQGLNEAGWVVGYFTWTSNFHGFYWSPDEGGVVLSPPAPYNNVFANDINDKNQIVGDLSVSSGIWRGFIYDIETSEWTILEPIDPDGTGSCWANAINNAGVVAGSRSIGEAQQPYNAFIWSADDGYTDLGVMEGPYSTALDINESGTVTGWTGWSIVSGIGYLHANGATEFLGTPGDADTSIPNSINGNNTVVGTSHWYHSSGEIDQHAIVWDGEFAVIANLEGYNRCGGVDASDQGIAVGSCTATGVPAWESFLWYQGNLVPMDDSFVHGSLEKLAIGKATALSNSGQIIARGNVAGSSNHGLVLSPIETPLGDLSGDCEVGGTDLGLLLSEWGQSDSTADLTGDGTVGGADLGVLLSNWTK